MGDQLGWIRTDLAPWKQHLYAGNYDSCLTPVTMEYCNVNMAGDHPSSLLYQ